MKYVQNPFKRKFKTLNILLLKQMKFITIEWNIYSMHLKMNNSNKNIESTMN